MVWGNLATGFWLGGAAAAGGAHWTLLGRGTLSSAGDLISIGGGLQGVSKVAEFDGSNSYINLGGSASDWNLFHAPTGSCEYSVSMWIKLDTVQYTQIFTTEDNSEANGVVMYINSSTQVGIQTWYGGSNNVTTITTSEFEAGKWYHLVITRNGGTFKIYKDGTEYTGSSSATGGTSDASYVPRISGNHGQTNYRIDGAVGQTLVYTDQLTQSEVTTLYNSGSVNTSPSTSGLKAWYKFEDNANDNHASFNGSATSVTFATNSAWTAKPYMMMLSGIQPTGSETYLTYRFNNDSGSNYAFRYSSDGSADSTNTGQAQMLSYAPTNTEWQFANCLVRSKSDQEKLVKIHTVSRGATAGGAGNAPSRRNISGVWTNDSDGITSVLGRNVQTSQGNFTTDSEIVVLGFDPDSEEGTNIWEELANVTLGSDASAGISSGTFTAKKYLWIQGYLNGTADGGTYCELSFNGDTGANYAFRSSMNGASDVANTSQAHHRLHGDQGGDTHGILFNSFILNKSDKEKLIITESAQGSAAGAGTAPFRYESVGKWVNTSSQITSMNIKFNTSTMESGSILRVWGFD